MARRDGSRLNRRAGRLRRPSDRSAPLAVRPAVASAGDGSAAGGCRHDRTAGTPHAAGPVWTEALAGDRSVRRLLGARHLRVVVGHVGIRRRAFGSGLVGHPLLELVHYPLSVLGHPALGIPLSHGTPLQSSVGVEPADRSAGTAGRRPVAAPVHSLSIPHHRAWTAPASPCRGTPRSPQRRAPVPSERWRHSATQLRETGGCGVPQLLSAVSMREPWRVEAAIDVVDGRVQRYE